MAGERAWASVHAQTKALLHRITAASLRLELIDEAIGSASNEVRELLSSLERELTDCARAAKEMLREIQPHSKRDHTTDVASLVEETMAPLARYLEKKEAKLVVDSDALDAISLDPEVLRAALAGSVQALLRRSTSGATLQIGGDAHRIAVAIAPADPAWLPEVSRELEEIGSLLEMLGAHLEVSVDRSALIVEMLGTEQ